MTKKTRVPETTPTDASAEPPTAPPPTTAGAKARATVAKTAVPGDKKGSTPVAPEAAEVPSPVAAVAPQATKELTSPAPVELQASVAVPAPWTTTPPPPAPAHPSPPPPAPSLAQPPAPEPQKKVNRGLAATLSTKVLKDRIWTRSLLLANRFRVIRTLDIAAHCFPERDGFKASLTAAQRAVRGMVRAGLIKRYRSDRFQTMYGLSKPGANWLEDAGHAASSSVRRVSDMTNPEHRLWAGFWTLACEARGLVAMTEQELLQYLNRDTKFGQPLVQGYLTVETMRGKVTRSIQLRPDAICREDDGSTTWCEIDRSLRGADRLSSLYALCNAIGRILKDGTSLGRVVVFCKTERIRKRAAFVLAELAGTNNAETLVTGRRHFRMVDDGVYEVWTAVETAASDGRTELVDRLVGRVNVQLLPIWLPKVRVDASNTHSVAGWFGENYLPYRRAPGEATWPVPLSPLLKPIVAQPAQI